MELKLKKIKKICGGYSVILSEKINLNLIRKKFKSKISYDNFGILKIKIDSKEITFFDYGEILFNGFEEKDVLKFLDELKKIEI